jgi:acyl-coenzyme A synthetase/AMP-(fatty) acid ligase
MINPIKYLISNAKLVPEKPAIISTALTFSYKECLERVQHLAIKFRKFGIKPGQIVCVMFYDQTLDLLVTLALIHEGVITISNRIPKLPDELNPDLILCDKEPDKLLFKARHLVFDKTWFAKDENIKDIVPQDYKSEDSLFRITLSSGTTGEPKCIPLTIKNMENRAKAIFDKNIGDNFSMFPQSSLVSFTLIFYSYSNQRPYYDAYHLESIAKLIIDYKIPNLIGSPKQLVNLIDYIKDEKIPITNLTTVTYTGSKISSALFEEMKIYLCKNIVNNYGSTELGHISYNIIKYYRGTNFIGGPNVGNKVEIVDELGNILKNEEEGLIRIKTPYMATEYYNNEVATKKFFKDSWFYSGDTGYMTAAGELYITGRNDERINLDGVKINPSKVDEIMESYPDIKEAACFGLLSDKGYLTLCAAYVTTQVEFDLEKFQEYLIRQSNNLLKSSINIPPMPKIFIKINNIPRNANGKIMRHELSKKYKLSATNQLLELKVT